MPKDEIRAKLVNAKDIDEVKAILAEAGEEAAPEDIERIWQELEHHKPGGKRKLDQDEMDAVAGGTWFNQRDWIKDGCAGTVQAGKDFCWSNDKCICLWENYTNDWDTCPDGKPHEFEYDSSNKKYTCKRCYHSYYKSPGSTGLFRPSAEHKII